MKNIAKVILMCMAFCTNFFGEIAADDQQPHDSLIPFSDSYYYHFSKDQKLSDLIQDFCSMQNISVVVSPTVIDIVNGRFNRMPPMDFWNYITKAYGLSWFYDGKILYVYKNNELQTQVFKMDAPGIATLSNIIDNLGFLSSDFSFRSVPDANILIITAPPQYLATINDLCAKFVIEKLSDTTVVKSFPLKYAWAYDMNFTYKDDTLSVPGVATLLQDIVGSSQQRRLTTSGMFGNLGNTAPQKKNAMQSLDPQTKKSAANDQSDANDQSRSTGNKQSQMPAGEFGFITCDQRLNAVIIRDSHENMPFYEDIIKQLDVPCEVIRIDVAIVDVKKNNGVKFGIDAIDLIGTKKDRSVSFGAGRITANIGTGTSSKVSTNGDANLNFDLKGIVKGLDIGNYIRALEESGNGQTVARPSVLTLDNVGAIIEQSESVYTEVKGERTSGLYDITASTKLQVVPHIVPDEFDKHGKRKMKMFVNVQDAGLEPKTNSTPQVNTNSVNTQAVLFEGQSLLIGGYFSEKHNVTENGIPILKDLPIIGRIFTHSETINDVKERIYVISPTVVDINGDHDKYKRFMQDGQLTGEGILKVNEFTLKNKLLDETGKKRTILLRH